MTPHYQFYKYTHYSIKYTQSFFTFLQIYTQISLFLNFFTTFLFFYDFFTTFLPILKCFFTILYLFYLLIILIYHQYLFFILHTFLLHTFFTPLNFYLRHFLLFTNPLQFSYISFYFYPI